MNQAGVLAPGNSIGETIVEGDYNQLADAKLQIEVAGTIDRDNVIVEGNAFLGGELEIGLVNGFAPTSKDTISVLSVDLSIFDAFSNVANGERLSTTEDLGSFIVNYGAGSAFNPNEVVLSNFLSSFSADFNDDGEIDGDDLLQWRGDFGLNDDSDADDDNDSDGNDFLLWQRQLGSGLAVATSVLLPEPSGVTLAILGLTAAVGAAAPRRWTRQPAKPACRNYAANQRRS